MIPFKKSIYLILGISTLLYSCSDFLDTTDPTKIGKGRFFQNKAQIDQAVNGVYGQLQPITNTAYLFGEMMSDNTTFDFNPLDRGGAAGWEAIEFSTINAANGEISAVYNNHYAVIYNINNTLERTIDAPVDEADKKIIEGQLKFLRAYLYFTLTQYFGDVILALNTLNSYDQAFDLARSPQSEVYGQIEKDLQEAINLLPNSYTGQAGRATKGAAIGLYGKVLLTQKKYEQAVTALRPLLSMGYALHPNYAYNYDPARKNGVESLFEIQYQGDNDLGEWSGFSYVFAPRLSGSVITGWATVNPSGRNIPTRNIISAYETGDLRKDISLKTGYTQNGVLVPIPYVNKYNYAHTIAGRTNTNWPVLRYADVLLMLAESINEMSSPTEEAYSLLNLVRTRAGLPDISGLSKNDFREAILKERRIELAFENHRWFDLKRTKTPEELAAFMNIHGAEEKARPTVDRGGIGFNDLDYVYSPYEHLLPIPALQIQINPKLSQNSNY